MHMKDAKIFILSNMIIHTGFSIVIYLQMTASICLVGSGLMNGQMTKKSNLKDKSSIVDNYGLSNVPETNICKIFALLSQHLITNNKMHLTAITDIPTWQFASSGSDSPIWGPLFNVTVIHLHTHTQITTISLLTSIFILFEGIGTTKKSLWYYFSELQLENTELTRSDWQQNSIGYPLLGEKYRQSNVNPLGPSDAYMRR